MGVGACQHNTEPTAVDIYYYMKQLSSPNMVPTLATFRYFLMYIWEGIGEIMLSTFLHSSWERGRVRMIIYGDLALYLY